MPARQEPRVGTARWAARRPGPSPLPPDWRPDRLVMGPDLARLCFASAAADLCFPGDRGASGRQSGSRLGCGGSLWIVEARADLRLSSRILTRSGLRGFETPAGFDTFGLVENQGLVLVR